MAEKVKRRRRDKKNAQIELLQGIYLNRQKLSGKQILLNGFLRSFIVFSVVFGSVGGFLSAFQISYNYAVVAFFYLLLSVYASLLYAAPGVIYRDFGYILFFAVFIPVIYGLRVYANSGLYEIVNQIFRQAELFFDLPGIMEYEVQISDSYHTVSVFVILLGMMEILFLNIWIYITMSIGWTVLITFPALLLPIYMKQYPNMFYVVLMGVGYLAVLIFKSNGHYMSFYGETKLRVRGRKKEKLSYTQNAGMLGQVLITVLILCLFVEGAVGRAVPQVKFERYFKNDTLRDNTSELVGNAFMLGMGGIFSWYDSTGGINGGKLGGVASVRPDGQPDLEVSFTPYSNEAVYLKAFTGGIYGDNQWENIPVFEQDSLSAETALLEKSYTEGAPYSAKGKMDIRNVGANIQYAYVPYYTKHETGAAGDKKHIARIKGLGHGMQQEKSYAYYPLQNRETLGQSRPAEMDLSKVDAIFLDVPEKNREVLAKQCIEMGLTPDMTEAEMIEAVRSYFRDNIPYTLRPGATPVGEDFVNYFLTKNRKGYCAHFATAATLLLRQMGIPARYAEGYAFSMETALISDINETARYADYYDGFSALGESAVLDVKVTDAMAHAWVEVYMDGFGWCVVEVTPGRAEATDEDDFWSIFSNLMDNAANADDNSGSPLLGDINLPSFSWLFYGVFAWAAVMLLWKTGALVRRKVRRHHAMHQPDEREALIARYINVCEKERLVAENFNACRSHAEQMCYFCEKYAMLIPAVQVSALLEKISFSRMELSKSEQEQIEEAVGQIESAIYRAAGLRQKIRLLMR